MQSVFLTIIYTPFLLIFNKGGFFIVNQKTPLEINLMGFRNIVLLIYGTVQSTVSYITALFVTE
jgi:hypothetical protein